MHKHKTVNLTGIKTAGLEEGHFIGWASAYGNVDSQGDRVVKGAFAKSIQAMAAGESTVVIGWEHGVRNDPRTIVGEVISAVEKDEGLEIHAKLDTDSEFGQAAYRAVKSRRIKALSIGYGVRSAVKAADGVQELRDLDLMEVSLVARPANTEARILAAKAAATDDEPSAIVLARRALAKAAEGGTETDDTEEPDPNKTHGERLLESLAAATAAAEAIVGEAEDEGRDLDQDEVNEVVKKLDLIAATKREIQAWADMTPGERHGVQHYHDVISSKSLTPIEFEQRWGTTDTAAEKFGTFDASGVGITTKTKATKEAQMTHAATHYLAIGSGRKSAAETIVTKIVGGGHRAPGDDAPVGQKALTSTGQIVSDVPMTPTPIPTGRPATSLLDVLPVTHRATPTWRYLRQTARTLNAAPVAPGDEKPVSDVSVTTIDGRAVVIAHLSSEVDKFVLADNAALTRFVADELVYGLDVAVQGQVLNGDGTGENLRGILNTSGAQVTAFATNILTSVRRAITSAEALGYQLGVLVMSPGDWETVELAAVATDSAVAFNGAPVDLIERRLWGLRVVLNGALPAKTAVALDPSAVSVDVVGRQVDVEWDGSGELFSRNAMRLRVEGRFGLSVYQPAAVYKVGTAA